MLGAREDFCVQDVIIHPHGNDIVVDYVKQR
jgi:hypothetical protein